MRVFEFGLFALASFFVYFLTAVSTQAHSVNESYVYFDVTEAELSGRIEVNTRDLSRALDQDIADAVPWTREEVGARASEILQYFEGRLTVAANGNVYPVQFTEITFLDKTLFDETSFAQLRFEVPGLSPTPREVQLEYDFIFSDIDPTHRGYALVDSNVRTGVEGNESYISLVFLPGEGPQTLYLDGQPGWEVFASYVKHGVWHVWFGFDHLLFLMAVLLISGMTVTAGRWAPTPDLGRAFAQTIAVVTVFTLANTVSLGLSAFAGARLSSGVVEAVIAISIAGFVLGNLIPQFHFTTWRIALVLGLAHGLSLASVLAPLGLDPARKAVGLAGFNTGIELGQIVIVVMLFPIFFAIRTMALYRPVFLGVGSVGLLAMTALWFVERKWDVLGPVRQMVFG